MYQDYSCMKCDTKKTIIKPTHMTNKKFKENLPEKVICGHRGCAAYAYQKEK